MAAADFFWFYSSLYLSLASVLSGAIADWSCCPPCGDGLRLELHNSPTGGDLYQWYAQPCGNVIEADDDGSFDLQPHKPQPCPQYSDRGCWYRNNGANQTLLQGIYYNTSRYTDYLPTRCALMARAANFSYFVLMDGGCYGTDDVKIFSAGPFPSGCSNDTTGVMLVFVFPDCGSDDWNTYLADIDMCIADGMVAETLADANYTCNKYNSSILTYSDFSEIVNSDDVSIQSGVYWLTDSNNSAICANYSQTIIDVYECSNYSATYRYYCKLPDSASVDWMNWQPWSACSFGNQTRFRYRLNSGAVDKVDIDTQSCVLNETAIEVVYSRLWVLKNVTKMMQDNDIVSIEEMSHILGIIEHYTSEDFSAAEAALVPDILTIMSQKMNITSSISAESVINSTSHALQGLVGNTHVWGEENNFALIVEPAESIITKCSEMISSNYSISLNQISIWVSKFDSDYTSTAIGMSDVSVKLPANIFNNQTLSVVAIMYNGTTDLFTSQIPIADGVGIPGAEENTLIDDVIFSLAISTVSHNASLKQPIEIQLPIIFTAAATTTMLDSSQNMMSTNMNAFCVFWDPESQVWASDGCSTVQNADSVTCQCSHLTSFAVLVQFTDHHTDDQTAEGKALTLISQIGCAVSLFCLITTFSVFIYLDNLKTERKTIHMNLIVALGLAQITHVVGINMTDDRTTCISIAVLLHLFYTATFTWMLCEGIQLYFKIIAVFDSESKAKRYIYFVIGWGTPFIIVGISIAARLNHYGHKSFCWLSVERGLIWAFVAPVCAVVIINLCIMIVVLRIVVKSAKSLDASSRHHNTVASVKAGVKGIVILTPLLGINWLFGLLAVNRHLVVFEFLFVLLNSLQGLFIFLFHCVGSSEVRAAFKRKIDQQSSKSRMNSISKVHDISVDKSSKGGQLQHPRIAWIKGKLFGAKKSTQQGQNPHDVMDKLVDGNLGPNLGGLKHLAPEQDYSTDSCTGYGTPVSDYPEDLCGSKAINYGDDFTMSFTSNGHAPPKSQRSDLSNKFSVASTTLTSLDIDSDDDIEMIESTPPGRSAAGSAGVRSVTSSVTAVPRQLSALSNHSTLPGIVMDDLLQDAVV